MRVAQRHVPANIEKTEHDAVRLLAVGRQLRERPVPAPVAVVGELAELVHGLLGREPLRLDEEADEVVVDAQAQVLLVRVDVVGDEAVLAGEVHARED